MRLFCNFLENLRLEFYFLENLVDFFCKVVLACCFLLRKNVNCSFNYLMVINYSVFFLFKTLLVSHIFLGISKFCLSFQTYWHKVLQDIPIMFSTSAILFNLIFKL